MVGSPNVVGPRSELWFQAVTQQQRPPRPQGRKPTILEQGRGARVDLAVEFIHDRLMDRLRFKPRKGAVAVHVTCSVTKMGLEPKLRAVSAACAVATALRCALANGASVRIGRKT